MRISFVIPAFNEEKYIVDCLKSILPLEGLEDFEIIVVDNNSTDNTVLTVVQNFKQAIIITEKKRGPAAARNRGAAMATGDYLAFIDADCRLPHLWFLKIREILKKKKNVALLNGPYKFFDDQKFLARVFYFFYSFLFPSIIEFIFRRTLGIGGVAFGGNFFVPKAIFDKSGGFNEKLEFYADDVEFANRLEKFGNVIFDTKLWVYSSARRLKSEGRVKMGLVYTLNGLWITFFKKVLIRKK